MNSKERAQLHSNLELSRALRRMIADGKMDANAARHIPPNFIENLQSDLEGGRIELTQYSVKAAVVAPDFKTKLNDDFFLEIGNGNVLYIRDGILERERFPGAHVSVARAPKTRFLFGVESVGELVVPGKVDDLACDVNLKSGDVIRASLATLGADLQKLETPKSR